MKSETAITILLFVWIAAAYLFAGHDDQKTREIAARNVPTYRETQLKKQKEREEAAALALFEIPSSNKKRSSK